MMSLSNPANAVGISNYIGHKGRCFDLRYSPAKDLFLSASEDGTAKIWNVATKRCQSTICHSKTSEVLRSAFISSTTCCTGGSDGKVIVWNIEDPLKLTKVHTIEHRDEESQIYACELVTSNPSLLITAADSQLYLWDVASKEEHQCVNFWNFETRSTSSEHFGGPRNVHKEVYVFDAKICPNDDSKVAVALSDASIRMVDIRVAEDGTQCCVLSPGHQPKYANEQFGHATSVSWSNDANSILVSMGSGKVVVLDTRMGTVRSVLIGHTSAAYGSCFIENDSKCLTWSSDSTIRAFDLSNPVMENFTSSYSSITLKDVTLFSCCVAPDAQSMLCGGGTSKKDNSFLGIPIQQVKSFW